MSMACYVAVANMLFEEYCVEIVCPQCGFARDVSNYRLPARAVIATCPECACRFRFSSASSSVDELAPPDPRPERRPEQPADQRAEDERRLVAEAYAREAARLENEDRTETERSEHVNPWQDAPGGHGWFAAFYQTVMRVMFAAPQFFAALSPRTGQMRELTFYVIVGFLQAVAERFWGEALLSALGPAAASDPQLAKMLLALAPETSSVMAILFRVFMMVLQLYFFSALIHLACRFATPKQADFSLTFQVVSYSAAPLLLAVVPLLGTFVGFVWSIACMVAGCRSALRLTWAQTLLSFSPLLLVMVMLVLSQLYLVAQG